MLKFVLICVTLFGAANLSDVSYYEILGLTKQATSQEIRQAYKKLAVKLHPDKNPDATEAEQEKFLKITEAYETLKDPDKRQKYDLYGSYPSYSRKYDYRSQSEYDNLFYNGLYHNDPFVETLSGKTFYNFLKEGFYFVNFYSPFCPPCQNVADHWKKLAEVYKGIVRIGAVNCKYHNSFCYNSMRIGSYPSLLFYPNGKNGNYIYYRGDRTFESLDEFVMKFISSQVHVPTVAQVRSRDRPMAYVLGENRIERNILTRIAYKLLGLVTLAVVEDDSLREELTTNDAATVVFRYRDSTKEIETTEEGEVLKAIVAQLPKIEPVDPNKLKEIRDDLRRGSSIPWVLYFSTKETDRLELHQTRISLPDMHFGEIDCDVYSGLCASLQVESYPAWGVMKEGGGYQRVKRQNLETSAKAVNLHSLSAAEFLKVLDQEMGVWVLLVAPYKLSWDHLSEPFTRASHHFIDDHIHFGIMECTAQTDQNCRKVAFNTPAILVQNGTKRSYYSGHHSDAEIIDFVQLLRDTSGMELTEEQVLENILDASGRSHTWLVAHFPARCGRYCEQLEAEWMKVYQKLRPLTFVRVGVLNCDKISGGGFCTNIRIPTARLYPYASGQHFSINLQQVSEAPYILEWALEHMDDSLVQKHSWHTFRKQVLVEELNPSSGTKPWLIYFHSPRCYRCYEMYADFVVAGILLNNAVHLSKVNCITERGLCQHEQISSYPSLRLYLNRNQHQHFSSVINIPVRSYNKMLDEIRPHLKRYNGNRGIGIGVKVMKHDEL